MYKDILKKLWRREAERKENIYSYYNKLSQYNILKHAIIIIKSYMKEEGLHTKAQRAHENEKTNITHTWNYSAYMVA